VPEHLDERRVAQFSDGRIGDPSVPYVSLNPSSTGGTG
jgi:hypothetical protein